MLPALLSPEKSLTQVPGKVASPLEPYRNAFQEEEEMRMDEAVIDEASLTEAEDMDVGGKATAETHAAKWARPPLESFDPKEKAMTFQVSSERLVPSHVCNGDSPVLGSSDLGNIVLLSILVAWLQYRRCAWFHTSNSYDVCLILFPRVRNSLRLNRGP